MDEYKKYLIDKPVAIYFDDGSTGNYNRVSKKDGIFLEGNGYYVCLRNNSSKLIEVIPTHRIFRMAEISFKT